MKIWIVAIWTFSALLAGCSVFRNTAVDQHVAVSRDLTLEGLAANFSEDKNRAEHLFTQAVDSDPDNVEARMLLAEAYRKRGQVDLAIVQLEDALKIAPENTELICQLGECYSVSKNEKYAYRLSQLALRTNRESVEAWNLKAQLLRRTGMLDQALADYQRALRIDPENESLRYEMAKLYLEMKRPLRALTTLDRIADDYDETEVPEMIILHQSLALQSLDRNREAIDRFQTGFERGNFSAQFAEAYVKALMQNQDLSKAGEILMMAQQRFPQAPGLGKLGQQIQMARKDRWAKTAQPGYR